MELLRRGFAITGASAAFSMLTLVPGSAVASSQMDAPLITLDPAANTTDVYAFVSEINGIKYLTAALAVYPFEEPGIGPNKYNFDDNVLYEIHVATGADVAKGEPTISYQFQFETRYKKLNTIEQSFLGPIEHVNDANQNLTQFYTVTKVRHGNREILGTDLTVPPNNQGLVTPHYNQNEDGNSPAKPGVSDPAQLDVYTAESIHTIDRGYIVFAGQRDDGFYANIQSIFDLDFSFSGPERPLDSQAGFNVHTIVINIPVSELGGDQQIVGVYATTSRRKLTVLRDPRAPKTEGDYVQVGRQGNPAFCELVVAQKDKDLYNETPPRVDPSIFAKYALAPQLAVLTPGKRFVVITIGLRQCAARRRCALARPSVRNYLICLLMSLSLPAWAHDPGLSTATVTVKARQIDIRLGFARKDAEVMSAVSAGELEIRQADNFEAIKPALESVAVKGIDLYFDGERASPIQSTAQRVDDQNIDVLLRFQRPATSLQVEVVSRLLESLPFGHRQFLSVRSDAGSSLGEAMLSAKNCSYQIDLRAVAATAAQSPRDHSFLAFLRLGIEHILSGYDHLLFLFALLVVCRNLRSILTVITCFTIAHSITLALASLEIVRLPGRVVEPLIAASIAYVGIENLLRGDAPKWRWLITFGFGLIHGLGFADALREFGIGSAGYGIILPLVGFNLGVEIGQLSVAGVILPILWQLRKHPSFVRRSVPACSGGVAIAGGYWMVERLLTQ
jgi:hydrogenase/urease accessory protein HupE